MAHIYGHVFWGHGKSHGKIRGRRPVSSVSLFLNPGFVSKPGHIRDCIYGIVYLAVQLLTFVDGIIRG
jgi:hypothetical protein